MQLCLFDSSSNRRLAWRRACQKLSVDLHCYETFDGFSQELPLNSRLLVIDPSVVASCFEAAAELVVRHRCDIVSITIPSIRPSDAMRLISAGVRWIFDDAPQPQELEEGLYQLARIVAEHDRRLQRYRLLQRSFASLTMGEGQVLAMVLEGRHNNEIASSLEISIRTVESRRANLYRKWDVASLAALARLQFEFEALRQLFEPNSDPKSF